MQLIICHFIEKLLLITLTLTLEFSIQKTIYSEIHFPGVISETEGSIVPEIQSETNKIFCHFEPFFALLPSLLNGPKNQNFEKK